MYQKTYLNLIDYVFECCEIIMMNIVYRVNHYKFLLVIHFLYKLKALNTHLTNAL